MAAVATNTGAPSVSPADDPTTLVPVLATLGGDLVTFSPATQEVRVTTLVAATPADVEAVLDAPAAYRQAIPALVRTDVVGRRPHAGATDDRLVEWEMEIPLFNLAGKMWVSRDGQRVVLDLVEGNFAPGQLVFSWAAAGPGRTVVSLRAHVNNQAGGWLIKRLVARSRFAGAAVNATSAYVAARATAALAEHPRDAEARRPRAAPSPPAMSAIDGRALGECLLGPHGTGAGAVGLVKRAPSGRLALVSVAVPTRLAAPDALTRLGAPESWRAFPGWKRVERLPATTSTPVTDGGVVVVDVEVHDNIPFVDFDARWRAWPGANPRAQAIDGDGRGAIFGWDAAERGGAKPPPAAVVLSMDPRLENLGYVPRKFIAAEPLLEQGLSLALAYVDAMSAKEAIEAAAAAGPPGNQKRQ
ncbi:MAG: hypothetical protein QOI66_824 [Myxococcales bacterium]|jgi:hypothetical protein|nr:hypothetical protein [Myxococcales bacterium]